MTRRVASILGAGFLGGIAIACVFIAGAIAGADVYDDCPLGTDDGSA